MPQMGDYMRLDYKFAFWLRTRRKNVPAGKRPRARTASAAARRLAGLMVGAAVVLGANGAARAACDVTWSPNVLLCPVGLRNWSNANCWSTGAVPDNTKDVCFNGTSTAAVQIDGAAIAHSLTVTSAYTSAFTFTSGAGTIHASGDISYAGTSTFNKTSAGGAAGLIAIDGNLTVSGGTFKASTT